MIAYRDGRPATVTSGGRVLVEFNGDTAEVSEEVGVQSGTFRDRQ